eukprot:2834351-Alexandrium_andersonii.AAC.1
MSGGVPDGRPGLDGGGPRAKRSRSAGASPSVRSPPISSTPTASTTPSSAPTAFGPEGVAGVHRRSPEGQARQPAPANPESARACERASGEAGWQGGYSGGRQPLGLRRGPG